MLRFRKKPVEVGAWLNDLEDDFIPDWVKAHVVEIDDGAIILGTLEGNMRADVGDWIIQGVKGEVYPCKPDIFEQTYEAV